MNAANKSYTDESLFSEIFKQHEYKLYSMVLAITKSHQFAEDIIQDVFMKLWECRASIREIGNMESWLYRVTENKSIDFLRKAAADTRLKSAVWNSLRRIANEAESVVEIKEYNEIIKKAIEQLPPQRRLIYQLNKEEGKNYDEIASQLRLSRHTVKNQLHSATQTLRRALGRSLRFMGLL